MEENPYRAPRVRKRRRVVYESRPSRAQFWWGFGCGVIVGMMPLVISVAIGLLRAIAEFNAQFAAPG